MKIVITGGGGLVGSALFASLTDQGHQVLRLVRDTGPVRPGTAPWNPREGVLDGDWLRGAGAVVHLAGENIAARRWTRRQMTQIRDSRIRGTDLLARRIAEMAEPPAVWFSASAVGYYGSRGDAWLTEDSEPGSGFLADVCRVWEDTTVAARERGVRVVNGRFGVILSANGGALAKMLGPFRLGLGGVMGSGRQFMSWISLSDAVRAIEHALLAAAAPEPSNPTPEGGGAPSDRANAPSEGAHAPREEDTPPSEDVSAPHEDETAALEDATMASEDATAPAETRRRRSEGVGAAGGAAGVLRGPVNIVSPEPVTNRQFTRALGRVLSRPTALPMPSPAVRVAFGRMGVELLLAGARVRPAKLIESGFTFEHPSLEAALRAILNPT